MIKSKINHTAATLQEALGIKIERCKKIGNMFTKKFAKLLCANADLISPSQVIEIILNITTDVVEVTFLAINILDDLSSDKEKEKEKEVIIVADNSSPAIH